MSSRLRLQSAGEFSIREYVQPGSRIVCGQACSEPLTLTQKLVAEAMPSDEWNIFVGALFSDTFSKKNLEGQKFQSYGAIGGTALLADRGVLDICPIRYSRLSAYFELSTPAPDLVLLQASAFHNGRATAGLSNDYALAAARKAKHVVVEVNDQVPWTYGSELPDDIKIDRWVAAENPPQYLSPAPEDEVSLAIAQNVASVVPDEATLQIGVGSIPDAALRNLRGHRNIGIHSGVYTDAVQDLVARGVVTNTHKGRDFGVSITNTICGTGALYRRAHLWKALKVQPPEFTHSEEIIASLHRFHAINSALQVDLTGQANSEAIDGRLRGGIGGLIDFCRGAMNSPQGRSITVMPATARGGSQSRIVATLGENPVTLGKTDMDMVITEFGIADLRSASVEERAKRLIAIAAPQFRDELRQAWQKTAWRAAK